MSFDLAIEYFLLASRNELSELNAMRMEEILEMASNDEYLNRLIAQTDALVFEDLCQENPTFVKTVLCEHYECAPATAFNTSDNSEALLQVAERNGMLVLNSLNSHNTKPVISRSRARLMEVYRQNQERIKQESLMIKNQSWHYGSEKIIGKMY
ncbi:MULTISPECIES: hypothetical protein [Nostocales]|uniref:Uncharacterized protein n=3 Tax=Nostocales TaxID=1161 RepID=A0A8S9T8Y1_9CYAN|nr:hypothetical protein [Tolypothrix bouteillei]KAF3888082.1 hypothetical protein DA73_0400023250 [Tolypothrix bouteillei VB521301]